ncbi:hypothetical protein L0F63_006637 [Massospora cicadina]|nr:hypothetical protein L0F63_006637 [Massospora cicadina]
METLTRLLYPQERHSLVGSVQHPKFRLSLLTARPYLKVELVGFEEITRPNFLQRDPKRRSFAKFRHAISDSQHLLSKVAEPDVEGFFEADRGEYSVPFEMQLSMKLPSSTESDRVKRHVSVRYLAIATVELKLPDGHLFTVTKSHPVTIYEKLQIHPELRAKLIETPQSAEVFHTFPGSSTSVHFGILIAKTLWVSGSLLTAQVTLRNSPKRRVSKVQLELIEVANSYRNFNSLDDEEIDEGIEDDNYSEGSTTLLDADLSHAAFSSSDASSLDTFSRVASKNALGRNAMPSQIDFENKERIWNLQLMVPLDSHTVQRTRFSSITHRVRASIGFYLAKQIYVELPVFIAPPSS